MRQKSTWELTDWDVAWLAKIGQLHQQLRRDDPSSVALACYVGMQDPETYKPMRRIEDLEFFCTIKRYIPDCTGILDYLHRATDADLERLVSEWTRRAAEVQRRADALVEAYRATNPPPSANTPDWVRQLNLMDEETV
jgi:hypothetical protein